VIAQKSAVTADFGPTRVELAWTPTLWLPRQVADAIKRIKPDVLHVQHEFNLYGGLLQGFLLSALVRRIRHRGTRTITTVHGVVAPQDVTQEFLRRNSLPLIPPLVRLAFRLAFRLVNSSSDLLIVHHEYFRDLLVHAYGIPSNKIVVIAPGVADGDKHSNRVRRTRGRRVLCIGFLTGYKLPELVVDVAEARGVSGASYSFCIGANPRAKNRRYDDRYASLRRRIEALGPSAKWVGYVPDEDLASTIASSDVVVLPYTECVSVSGIAGLARQSGTAICYSRPLRPLFGATAFEFELNPKALATAISNAFSATGVDLASGLTTWCETASATEAAWNSAFRI